MVTSASILIAGAGTRVSAFVVPALLSLGVRRDNITILRRQLAKPGGALAGINVVDRVDALSGSFALTVNCVTKNNLVEVQHLLIDRFPKAIHFCDTPIFTRWSDLPKVAKLARTRNLFSLEDWPTMPNLQPILELCRTSPNSYQVKFEHIGVTTHFLSAARKAAEVAGLNNKRLVGRRGKLLSDRPVLADAAFVFQGPKDLSRAKIAAWNGSQLIEDFFEIYIGRAPCHASDEVIYRQVEGNKVRYLLGRDCFRQIEIPGAILSMILKNGTREAAHHLDKCFSLMEIFRNVLQKRTIAYGYSQRGMLWQHVF